MIQKSFAIGAFLSSLLFKEQIMISDEKNLVQDNTKSKRDHKASVDFEQKIADFKTATFISRRCFCCCCFYTGERSPFPTPPPKKLQNCRFVSFKTFVKSAQNRSLSSEICPENFREIPAESAASFREFDSENPTNLTFFPRPIRGPVL